MEFGVEEAADSIGEAIVTGGADAADREDNICLGHTPVEVHGQVLPAPVAVEDTSVLGAGPAGMDCLLQHIEDEAGPGMEDGNVRERNLCITLKLRPTLSSGTVPWGC